MSVTPVLILLLLCGVALALPESITEQEQQELVLKGISAARSAAFAMKALTALQTVSKFGAILGPIMTAAGVGAEIAFALMGVESEELVAMRREFAGVNSRLDHFSDEFSAVKRKIDWAAVQVAFASHESSVRILNQHRERVMADPSEKAIEAFLTDYEFNFGMAGDRLFLAMAGDKAGSPLAHNVFEAARVFTRNHRRQTLAFVSGGVQLLAQAAAVQMAYVTLRYREPNATAFLHDVLLERMEEVERNARAIVTIIEGSWKAQAQQDMAELAAEHVADSNGRFASRAYTALSDKFEWRRWAVVAYPELSGFAAHAISTCGGHFLFRTGGRNVVWASRDAKEKSEFTLPWAWKVKKAVQEQWIQKNQALGLMQLVNRERADECEHAKLVVIGERESKLRETLIFTVDNENHMYRFSTLVRYCYDPLCWFKGKQTYSVFMWG